jgi:C1A family cysteine protease
MAAKRKAKSAAGNRSKRILNLVPSRGTENDWGIVSALASSALTAPLALPTKVDLRAPWWSIGNQLNTGSCVGWATADGVMRYLLVTANKLPKTGRPSPRFVWMGSKETDQFTTRPQTFVEEAGTSLKAAMDIVRKYGVVEDAAVPFQIGALMYTGDENSLYAAASMLRVASYYNLGKDLQKWKTWLASRGPILAGLNVDDTWMNVASNGNLVTFKPATVQGGHAVCIVGYDAKRFIIRNSWGTGWGDKGFAYASPAYLNAAFFAESYGATL